LNSIDMKKENLVILFSGGADSTLLLDIAIRLHYQPLCILIDYGQSHVKELDFAKTTCLRYDVSFQVITLQNLGVNSALTGNHSVQYTGVSEWHVPSRNLMFVSIAASIAESHGINLIWYGANYEDREHLFPDCYQEWVFAVNEVLKRNGSMKIAIEAPLLGMSKNMITQLCSLYKITNDQIFSGYGQQETE